MMARLIVIAAVLLLAGQAAVNAATIVIVNMDGAGEGFNDPTPVAPVGGNPGTTIGQQRLNVFQAAADIWGALLPSAVTIGVEAQFDPLPCSPDQAYLGFAGTLEVFRDFPGAELTGTWYPVALANKLAGVDLSTDNDIGIFFNSDIDNNNNCLQNTNWYYGLDGNEGSDVELLPVVLHELAHGLGFTTFIDMDSGAEFMGFPDIYETFVWDNSSGLHWDDMTNGQRLASKVNDGNVVWDGPVVTAMADDFLSGTPVMLVNSPPSLPDTIAVGRATFGPGLTIGGITGDVVLVDDGTGTTSDACEPIVNGAEIAGNIALIDLGGCAQVSKVLAAEAAGAIAVLLANIAASSEPFNPSGEDPGITMPTVGITLADANAIKAELVSGVNVTLTIDPNDLEGADENNRVQLYARSSPSAINHWDREAFPDLLMEPFDVPSLSSDVDLTLAHFADLGWVDLPTGVAEDRKPYPLFAGLKLYPNYPNPFNPSTTIRYAVSEPQEIRLAVYDVRGRLVRSLAQRVEPAGIHEVRWEGRDNDGRPAASGIYFVRLIGDGQVTNRKIVLLK
jgi:hypothetical protein